MSKRKLYLQNHVIFHDYYTRLKNIAVSIFKWENLPESCNARFLEDTLFHYGNAVFVDDQDMGYLNLKVTPAATLNVYNEPTAYTAYSTGYNKIYQADDCVLIRNNPIMKSTESSIRLFAERLTEIELSLGVNINAQKTPILVRCDEKTKATLKALYAQYEGNEPVIFGHKALQEKPLEVLNTSAPFVSDKLREEKRAVWDDALQFLGINTNPSPMKKERLINAEVAANNEETDVQSLTMLLSRQNACTEINKKYGLDVKVSLRVEELKSLWDYGLRLYADIPEDAVTTMLGHEGGKESGKVHA